MASFYTRYPIPYTRVVTVPLMVISDDQVNSALAADLGLLDGGDAAVDRDDQPRAVGADLGEGLFVEAVAFFDAVGDVVVDFAAELADRVPEDGSGGDAVDVVIAVDDDLLSVADGLGDAVGGAGQIWDQGGVGEALRLRS